MNKLLKTLEYNKIAEKLSSSKVNTNGLALQGQTARTQEGKQKQDCKSKSESRLCFFHKLSLLH